MNLDRTTPTLPSRSLVALYFQLAKSGIVTLVLISVLGGFLIGQPFEIPLNWTKLVFTLLGILLLSSGSSALNQYQDREIDALMPRTMNRPLPSGQLSSREVIVFVAVTLILGLLTLVRIDLKLFWLGITAVISYNGLYTLWWKRKWAYAAIPGAIPGALPILMGHVAATGNLLHPAGIYLFFILFYWQMPHFWVLALKFETDYRAGHIPTLPVARGVKITVIQIAVWCVAYVALALMGTFFLHTGWIAFAINLAVSLFLLKELRQFVAAEDPVKAWLKFFLWINFSLIFYIAAYAIDLWSVYLPWQK